MYVKSYLSIIFIKILSFKDKLFLKKHNKKSRNWGSSPWTSWTTLGPLELSIYCQGSTLKGTICFISIIKMLPVIKNYKVC